MDNRIPKIISDFTKKEPENEIEFLSFNDWLSKKENQSTDWIVIATNYKVDKFSDYYTISCLIKADKDSLNNFLSNSHWYIDSTFGIPNKYQTPYEGEEYDDGMTATKDGVLYMPFTFSRFYHKYHPDHFQVIEHFLLYYNCFWVGEKKEYQCISENGEIMTIIKYIKTEKEETYLVDTHKLRDYLAVRNMYLARFHDHKRRSKKDISQFLGKEITTYELKNSESFFKLDLRTDIQYKEVKSTSRLLGKDIVKPYSEAQSHDWSAEIEEREHLEFIIGRDKSGKEIKSNCDPELLSSYFEDKGTPHFLTPVFFKRDVLQKYYAEPKKYKVSELSISYLNIWMIQIDITTENIVHVYLGDIGTRLPSKEQLHWRQFNIVPKGKISAHRFKRDFLTQFASPELEEAPIFHFKETFEDLQKCFEDYSGQKLFKELATDDLHLFSTLHIPITDEWKELDEQILALAKITTDSFNNKALVKLTGKKIGDTGTSGKPIKGLLALFYELLTDKVDNEEKVNALIKPFNMIQSLRSSSVAHRKSKDLQKTLVKYDLTKLSNEDKFRFIITNLVKSMKAIIEKINTLPNNL